MRFIAAWMDVASGEGVEGGIDTNAILYIVRFCYVLGLRQVAPPLTSSIAF